MIPRVLTRPIRAAIERRVRATFGVDASIGMLRFHPLRGVVALEHIAVENPTGFVEPCFLTIRTARLSPSVFTWGRGTIRLAHLGLEGVELNLERHGWQTNVASIFEWLRRAQAEPQGPGALRPGRRFAIEDMRIRGIAAHVRLGPDSGALPALDLALPDIEARGIGLTRGGVTGPELAAVLLRAVLEAIVESRLPSDLAREIRDGLEHIGRVHAGALNDLARVVANLAERLGNPAG